jgi:hypothetical protein
MSNKNNSRNRIPDPIAAWNALLAAAAEADIESGEPTPEDRRWMQSVDAMVQARLDTLQRQLTGSRPAAKRGVVIPPELEALDRAGLLARLEATRGLLGVRYAHKDLKGLSDHDLRTMLVVSLKERRR